MTILLSVVCNKCPGLFIIAIWRPHRGNIHIISCLSGQFSQFRRNESIVTQYWLIHTHFTHLLQNQCTFLVQRANHYCIRILPLNIGQLSREIAILTCKGLFSYNVDSFCLQRLFEVFFRRYMLFIVISIENGYILISQHSMRFLYRLWYVHRFRYGVSEQIITSIRHTLRSNGNSQRRYTCLLCHRPYRLSFIGSHWSNDNRNMISHHFLCGIDSILRSAFGIFGLNIYFKSALIDSFLLRNPIGGCTATQCCDKSDLCCIITAGNSTLFVSTACHACCHRCNNHSGTDCFHCL